MVFIGEESSKRRVNACIPTYIFMAYYIMFLWISGREGTRSKVTGNFLVNALHAFHRFNRRYHVKKDRNGLGSNDHSIKTNKYTKIPRFTIYFVRFSVHD